MMNSGGGRKRRCIPALIVGLGLLGFGIQGFASGFSHHEAVLCASVDTSELSPAVFQRLGEEFFSQEDLRATTDAPVSARSVFYKNRDTRIFLVSRWYGLTPQETYTFSTQWIDPDKRVHHTSSASFQTPKRLDGDIYFTHTAFLDVTRELPAGEWTVKLLVNGELADSIKLTITSSEEIS